MCLATGVGWALMREVGSFGLFLLTLSFLGASAVAAAGWWQLVAGSETRVFVLVLLAALSGGYVASNVIGLLVAGHGVDPLGASASLTVVRVLSWAGLALGGVLYLATLWAAVPALRERGRVTAGSEPAS